MGKVYFATTNEDKLSEAREILGIEIKGVSLEVDEIQSLDPIEVAVKKARDYFSKLSRPIFVEDVSLIFKVFGKLPGTYINDFLKELGNKGLTNLIQKGQDRTAIAQTTLVFIDKNAKEHVFKGVVKGKIAKEPRGENGFGWDAIFIPNGETKTFAEMKLDEKNKYSMRAKALEKFKEWLVDDKI